MARDKLLALMERYNNRCVYCQREVFYCSESAPTNSLSATRDHFLPIHAGGSGQLVNMVLACMECNALKGGMNPYQWQLFVSRFGPENMQRVMDEIVHINNVVV